MGKHDSCFLETLKYWPLEKEQAKKKNKQTKNAIFSLYQYLRGAHRRFVLILLAVGTAMKAVMIILAVAASVSTSKVAIHSRSSFLQTVKDRYLIGHVTDRLKASSILLCAQLCLKRRPLCCSINYRDEDGKTICELNDKRLESVGTDSSSFVSMPGFIFAQLLNFEVCTDMTALK